MIKDVNDAAEKWSKKKKTIGEVIKKETVLRIKGAKEVWTTAAKDVKKFASAFSPKVLDVFKKLDDAEGENKKVLANKLLPVHSSLATSFEKFVTTQTAGYVRNEWGVAAVQLNIIKRELENAAT